MNKLIATLIVVTSVIGLAIAQRSDNVKKTKPCYAANARVAAKFYMPPDPDFDPVLGYSRSAGPRKGSPVVDENGFAQPIKCIAAPRSKDVKGTLPKFYCTAP